MEKEQLIGRLKDMFQVSEKEAEDTYREVTSFSQVVSRNIILSEKHRYVSSAVPGKALGDRVIFRNGAVYDRRSNRYLLYDQERKEYGAPQSASLMGCGGVKNVTCGNPSYDYSCLIANLPKDPKACHSRAAEADKNWMMVSLDAELMETLFTKLFFLNGYGLKHFQSVIADDDNLVYVYEIKW